MAGAVLFVLIAYNLSIKQTFSLKDDCELAEQKIALAQNASEKIQVYQTKLQILDQRIGTNISTGIDFQDLLLEEVSAYCKENKLVFRDMQLTHQFEKGKYQIETNFFSVEGGFIALLKLVYNLETNYNTGQIASVHFESKKDFKTKRRRLFVHVYYQNINSLY